MRLTRLSTEEKNSLAILAQQGDKKALEKLVNICQRLIYFYAKKYSQVNGAELDDFIQEGFKCLIDRVLRTFDYQKSSIVTHCAFLVEKEMRDLYRNSNLIRSPKKGMKIGVDFFDDLYIREDPDDMTLDHYPVYEDMNALKPDISVMAIDELDEFKEIYILIMVSLKKMSNRNQEIFCYLYGLNDCLEQRFLEEASVKFGITRERVRQIVDGVWLKMPKEVLKGKGYKEYKNWFEDKIKRIVCICEYLHIDTGELINFLTNS